MFRQQIVWSQPPSQIRRRVATVAPAPPPVFVQPPPAPPPPAPPVADASRPVLESIREALRDLDQRREQNLVELQQVALELAVAVASQLVHAAIDVDVFQVEHLVAEGIRLAGLDAGPRILLHPHDAAALRRLPAEQSPWNSHGAELVEDSSIPRGGCRVETVDGRVFASDVASRLSEIRRHWMEELDDAQTERRRAQGLGSALRRFPDRRETA